MYTIQSNGKMIKFTLESIKKCSSIGENKILLFVTGNGKREVENHFDKPYELEQGWRRKVRIIY